jgi:hypothetical protein
METRKGLFEIDRQFGHAPLIIFASPGLWGWAKFDIYKTQCCTSVYIPINVTQISTFLQLADMNEPLPV